MTFQNLYRQVERYLNMEGADVRNHIKDFINDSIIDFIRLYNWEYSRTIEDITAVSEIFNLNDLSGRHSSILDIFTGSTRLKKISYIRSRTSVMSGTYSVVGNILYLPGPGDYSILYKSFGSRYIDFVIVSMADFIITVSGNIIDYLRPQSEVFLPSGNSHGIVSYDIVDGNTDIEVDTEVGETEPVLLIEKDSILQYDTDSVAVIQHYGDIIKHLTALKMLNYLGDTDEAGKEERIIAMKIDTLKRHENRSDKEGRDMVIAR